MCIKYFYKMVTIYSNVLKLGKGFLLKYFTNTSCKMYLH